MAEQGIKPKTNHPEHNRDADLPKQLTAFRRLLPIGLALVGLLAGCFARGNQPSVGNQPAQATATIAPANVESRPTQSSAALTRVASSLAQAPADTPTPTVVVVQSEVVPLPTVTPTLVPSPVATRTIEIGGSATLRLQLDSEAFESNGQPVTIEIEPRSYILGGDTLSKSDQWCMQVGATGLVFDLQLALQPLNEALRVDGELQLYDGFCGTWGNLGNQLTTVPLDLTVPPGSTARLAPTLQVQGSLMGLDNLVSVSTGVYLDLTFRNPLPR